MHSKPKSLFVIALAVAGTLGATSSSAQAAGAARTTPPKTPTTPSFTTPNPVRNVFLQSVGTKPFQLPNGVTINLQQELDAMLMASATGHSNFSPTTGSSADPCNTQIQLHADVTTFDLSSTEIGLRFGYTPAGSTGIVTQANGSVDVQIGTIAMVFSVWECTGGQCHSVDSRKADQVTAQVTLNASVNFGVITTAASLVHNTSIGPAIQKIMDQGIQTLAASTKLNELTWKATVRQTVPGAGTLIFDAGLQDRLGVDQTFVVYASTPATGSCDVFLPVAHIHTTAVDTVSSSAIIDQSLDARGIQVGDIVMVEPAQ